MLRLRHFQQYFSYIVEVSSIGGGNRMCHEKTISLSQVTEKQTEEDKNMCWTPLCANKHNE